jgi:hypothetical protein
MSIENEADKDLALSETDAENVAGGRMVSKKTAKHKAPTHKAKTYPVTYINANAPIGPVDDSGTTAWSDDCDDPSAAEPVV